MTTCSYETFMMTNQLNVLLISIYDLETCTTHFLDIRDQHDCKLEENPIKELEG